MNSPPPASLLRTAALAVAVFAIASGSIALTRFEGGAAFIWPATAVLLTFIVRRSPREWLLPVVASGVAFWLASALFGLGPLAGIPIALAIMFEAVLAAALLTGMRKNATIFDDIPSLGVFAIAAGVIAPAASGIIGGLAIAVTTGQHFGPNFWAWFAAHSLGTLSFAPLLSVVFESEDGLWVLRAKKSRQIETFVLLFVVALICFIVFGQATMPLLFLLLLPVMLTTFRLGRFGAASSVALLALIGGLLTLRGHGPISLLHVTPGVRAQFFQLYLAVTVMMTLPAAAELKQRGALMLRALESEARYRLLAENLGDTLIQTNIKGEVLFASPAVHDLTGYAATAIIGKNSRDCVIVEDLPGFDAARAQAIGNSEQTITLEYRTRVKNGEIIWCETRMRSYVDEDGIPVGIILVVRNASVRKAMEAQLSLEATTDALTGLPNRRAFLSRLDDLQSEMASGTGVGCVALLDVDFFKRVNDVHGHATGDLVLKTIAMAAKSALRTGDMMARVGGEEFGLVLSGTSVAQAAATCERVRGAIASCRVKSSTGAHVLVTASLGLTSVSLDSTSGEIYERADRMLYEAKAKGRNRVLIAA